MRKNKGNYISLILMIVISLVSQVLTLMKSSVVAGTFGTGADIDAYNLANSIVSFVFGFVAAGISTVIIPEYANKRDRRVVNTFITIVYGSLAVIVVAMLALRYQIAGAFSNRTEMFSNIVANAMVVLLLSQYLNSILNITVAYFQCEGKYNIPKIINLFAQLAIIACLIFLKDINIMEYAAILAAGVVVNFLFDAIIAVKNGWRFSPTLLFNTETKTIITKFIPIVFSTGAYRLSLMVDSTISAMLEEGMITILGYSSHISTMVNSILVGNLLIYIYPKITKTISEPGAQNTFWKQSAVFHAIVCMVITGFVTVGHEGVDLLFRHGKFSAEASQMVYIGAAIYILGQQTSILRDLMYRYFYAVGDTKTPAANSVLVSALNIVISIVLVKCIGYYGIILGTILASLFSLVNIFIRFGKKIKFTEKIWSILKRYFVNLGITAVTILLVLLTKMLIPIQQDLVSIAVFGIETVLIYLGLTFMVNREVLVTLKKI